MKKLFVISKWMLFLTLFVVLIVFTNHRQSAQKMSLHKISIKSSFDNFLDRQIVLEYLYDKLENFDTTIITNVSIAELENLLYSHPSIKEVQVFASQKGDVNIIIEQKQPIVRVKTDSEDYYLDEFGDKMELSDNYTPKLVVATGSIAIKDHKEIYKFIKEINKSEFWRSQITQIHFDNDDILLIPRVGDHKINIGGFENIVDKLDNLYQFYRYAMHLNGWQYYTHINLKFNNQIVCTKK
tara:strand:+ start:4773 stop:5492 length:720 start_codon:yes stop_codon:yes gene_type:complete